MKTQAKRILPLATLAILLVSLSPIASASSITINLNPTTGVAKVDSISTSKIVFTYPANSTISDYLKSVSSSLNLKGSFDGSSSGALELQGSFDGWNHHIKVSNMSVSLDYSAKGNTTALVINKVTNVSATVSGVFSVVNGTVTANLGWRAFAITGAMNLPLEGHDYDVNLAGSAMMDSLGSHGNAAGWLLSAFGGDRFWNRPTLNFSELNTPLSTWTKNYDAATNTTTFSKTISGQDTFSFKATYNGQAYSLSSASDPSGTISVQGYANASGESLVMEPAPSGSSTDLLVAGAAFVAVAIAVGYLAYRSKAKTGVSITTATTAPV
jgi:hypothetical protein